MFISKLYTLSLLICHISWKLVDVPFTHFRAWIYILRGMMGIGQAVTCEEFFAAMRDANDADFSNFLLWYVLVFISCVDSLFLFICLLLC